MSEMPVKIHLTGKINDTRTMHQWVENAQRSGHSVTSTSCHGGPDWSDVDYFAHESLYHIRSCDYLVVDMTSASYSYRDAFFELGYAIGHGKRIIIIAPESTSTVKGALYYHHPTIMYVTSWEEAKSLLVHT